MCIRDSTNGPLGIKFSTPLFLDLRAWADTIPLFDMSLKRMKEVEYFYVTGIALVLTVVVINRVLASHFGRAFEALRDSPIACDCMGVSVYKHKVIAFVLSAGLAGLAGVLFAYSEQYIAPNNFSFELSIQFLLAVTMGGRKSRPVSYTHLDVYKRQAWTASLPPCRPLRAMTRSICWQQQSSRLARLMAARSVKHSKT